MKTTLARITSNNKILVELFNKDSLYHDLTNPTSQSHYKEVEKKLISKYGIDEFKKFNSEVKKELKKIGLI